MKLKRIGRFLAIVAVATGFCACSSTQTKHSPETQEDRVIARINDASSRPDWLDESKPFKIENGEVLSLGQTTIPGDNKVEAAYRIAENNAKGAIASSV